MACLISNRFMHRQEREALWSHFELLEGRNNSFARDKEGADGTAGRNELKCGQILIFTMFLDSS